jgi:predicted metalloprotease with PDZ domain
MKKQFLIGLIVMVVAASGVVALWAQDDTAPPYLGIAYQPDGLSGLFVTNVQDDSPAAEAGLRAGDILVALDQSAVSVMNIQAVLSDYTPGDTVTLIVQRGDEALSLELTLTERPDDFTAVPDIPDMPDLPEEFRFEAHGHVSALQLMPARILRASRLSTLWRTHRQMRRASSRVILSLP